MHRKAFRRPVETGMPAIRMSSFSSQSGPFPLFLNRPISPARSVQREPALTASPGGIPVPGLAFFP